MVSWGYGCADADYPGIYGRVSSFFDFLHQYVGGLPTAVAGDDQMVDARDQVNLDGSHSSDVGVGSIVSYEWTQLSGEPVTLSGLAAKPTFTAPNKAGDLKFELVVTDDGGNTARDDVVITVNPIDVPPIVRPGDTSEQWQRR